MYTITPLWYIAYSTSFVSRLSLHLHNLKNKIQFSVLDRCVIFVHPFSGGLRVELGVKNSH